MKTLTRKSFLKILGTGASITALCALPTICFGSNRLRSVSIEDF